MASKSASLKFLTVAPRAKHTATVIFIHGLGDSGHGWKPVADMWAKDPALQHIKFILPHAPIMPVTINMGMPGPSWFDILSLSDLSQESESTLLAARSSIQELIDNELAAVPEIKEDRLLIGGFSQGGVMSLLTGLTGPKKVAGVACVSGWLPLHKKFKEMLSPHATSLPVFLGHGRADDVVEYKYAVRSADELKTTLGFPTASASDFHGVRFESYPRLGHSVDMSVINDLGEWMKQVLPST